MSDPRSKGLRRLLRYFSVSRRFRPLIRPHRRTLLGALACMFGFIVTGLMVPWPVALVLDGVLTGKKTKGILAAIKPVLPEDRIQLLAVCCAGLVVIAVLRGLFSYGQNLLTATAGQRVVSDLRVLIFQRMQRLSLRFHGEKRTGDLLVRLTGDVSMLREILVPAVIDVSQELLTLAGMLILMFLMDVRLTLLAIGMVPLLAFATARYGGKIRVVSREQRKKEGRIATVAGEALASVAMVQAYSREEEVTSRFTRQNDKSLVAGLRSLRLEESLSRIVEVTLAAGSCLTLWFGAERVLDGQMTLGELTVFLSYVRGVYKPIQSLVRISNKATKAVACGERVLEVLDSKEEIEEAPDAVPAPALTGEIIFENVTFGYDPGRLVLDNVSFRIPAGQKVGLVGPSGSGKSTILSLLVRLYEPRSGRILVDGVDIRRYTLESYRRQIAVVLQEPFLFGVSVAENIRFGKPEASLDEARVAAAAAEALGFIEDLPAGFETILGERGASLSRGQQQRIALARAILRDAPIFVYDEPTTGLDARTEVGVLSTLSLAAAGHTCLWIAHGLDQILGCPRIIVLRDGRILADGAPADLIERAGAFLHLYGDPALTASGADA